MGDETAGIDLRMLLHDLTEEELEELVESLPHATIEALVTELGGLADAELIPHNPAEMGSYLDSTFVLRPHLAHLSERLAVAVRDIEAGKNRRLIIEMPPRTGKTYLATMLLGAWILARHPDWPVALTSHDGSLAVSWGRAIRRWAEEGKLGRLEVASDSKAASEWETTDGGVLLARSVRESLTGRGAKVLVIDDPHKDFVEAHSEVSRNLVWNWWLSVAQTRLQPPNLVIVTMTRWHEDDLVGRLLSREYPGDPDEWEVIRLPALAEDEDAIGREPGAPLLSPLVEESEGQALERWAAVKRAVGSYTWAAMFQQRPSPPEGAVFGMESWRFWTTDPALASRDEAGEIDPNGKTVLIDPAALAGGHWLDSWDMAFKGGDKSDFVVGQRWVRVGPYRYLIAQERGRWGFSRSLTAMRRWARTDDPQVSPFGQYVHERLIEDAANGAAIIDTLKTELSGIKPVKARVSKEARARAVTPEIESGHVLLPHPQEPGYGWVTDLLSELRAFPNDANDDQVDAMTQALLGLRSGSGSIHNPANAAARPARTPAMLRQYQRRLT